jgi:hypothetical protein
MDHRLGGMGRPPHAWPPVEERYMRTSAPSSIEGIEKYLASGMIRGIGPVYTRKMVKACGEAVFEIIVMRGTQKPLSPLWKVTRSTVPACTARSG